MRRSADRREAALTDRLPFLVRAAVLVSLLGLAGCGSVAPSPGPRATEPPTPIPVETYFPLSDNSQWTYRVQDFVKKLTYLMRVRVHGKRYVEALKRDGISVEERYSSFGPGGPFVLEEQEPILYFHENGFLNRVLLTYQAGKVVVASGSGDSRYLPELLSAGAVWDSNTEAFRVGDLGFRVSFRHVVLPEREVVKVPAGTFEGCVRIDTSASEGPGSGYRPGEELVFYYSDWYTPGVGLVLTRHWDDEKHERERTRIELMEYSIASAAAAAQGVGG
ncbi:MAG: hypothetical protein ACREQQ_19150 [Candidatus Binatia bacterium]